MDSSLRCRAWRDAVPAVATLALCVVLFPGALLRAEIFFERDLNFDWYLRMAAVSGAVHAGAWPVWDPAVGFGQPLLADPGTEVLYPFTWLALLLPRDAGYTAFVIAHLVLAAIGTARLARRLGAGRLGAVLAALVFVLSGPVQSAVNLRQHLAALAWMPWVLLALEKAMRAPGWRTAAALAAAAGLQTLAGSGDVCAMTWLVGGGFVVFRLVGREGSRRPRVLTVLGAATLTVALTAAVWWPAADLLARSPRRDLPLDIRGAWSVPPQGLLRLVVPLDPARVVYSPGRWRRLFDRSSPPFLHSLYLGLTTLSLSLVAVLGARRRGRAVFLAAIGLAALAFALGPHTPVYPTVCALLPPLRIFRYPSKATWVVALVVALLAGLGVRRLGPRRLSPRRVRGVGLLLVAAAVMAEAVGGPRWTTMRPGTIPAVAITSALVLLAASFARIRPRLAALAVATLGVAELAAAHAGLNATGPAGLLFDPPPAVALVDRTEGHRLYVYDYHSVAGTAERLLGRPNPYLHVDPPPGWDERRFDVVARQLYLPPPAGGLFGLEGSFDFDIRGLYSRDLNDLVFFLRRVEGTPVHAKLLRMGAVGTVLSLHRQGLAGLVLERELPSLFPEPILVWRVPRTLSRERVVGGVRVGDGAEAFSALLDPAFDPAQSVLLPDGTPRPSSPGFVGHCRLVRRAPDRITLEVEASAPAHVVLADAFDPGWQATVDGRKAAVRRADVAFRAVAFPAGRHVVEMVYRPRPVRRGLSVSAVAVLALLGILVVGRRRPGSGGE